jgi:hypothetical protein
VNVALGKRVDYFLAPFLNLGVGEDASAVEDQLDSVVMDMHRSVCFGTQYARAMSALAAVAQEASASDWDGYDGVPVCRRATKMAAHFLRLLPNHIRMPEISVHPNGFVGLEWDDGPWHVLTIAIGSTYRLHYAATDGPSRLHGTGMFVDELPPIVLSILENRFSLRDFRHAVTR